MEDIRRFLNRTVPVVPTEFISAAGLVEVWARCCPSLLMSAVCPLFYCRGRLYVSVRGSAFAARLRQDSAGLLIKLRAEPVLSGLTEIVGRPAVDIRPQIKPKVTRPVLKQAPSCVAVLAQATTDPALRTSLIRLAHTLSTTGDDEGAVL